MNTHKVDKPVDPDLLEQANPGHGVPSQDPDAAAQVGMTPQESEREAESSLVGGGAAAGMVGGAAVGAVVGGPVGAVIGATAGAVAGGLGGAAAGAVLKPGESGVGSKAQDSK